MRANKPGLADLKKLRQATSRQAPPDRAASDKAAPGGIPPGSPRPGGKSGRRAKPRARAAGPAASTARDASTPDAGPTPSDQDAPALPADDKALFRQAMKSVRPLARSQRAVLPPVPAAPRAVLRERRQAAAGREAAALPRVSDHYSPAQPQADQAGFLQPGHGPDLLKGLRRGKWPIGASLDLHGATLEEARTRLDAFLRSCLDHRIKCVRIVHGKGYGSKDGAPVLKETVRRWLAQMQDVMAYAECSEQNGGAGAVQVLLRLPD